MENGQNSSEKKRIRQEKSAVKDTDELSGGHFKTSASIESTNMLLFSFVLFLFSRAKVVFPPLTERCDVCASVAYPVMKIGAGG